jgi:hypothetical protein
MRHLLCSLLFCLILCPAPSGSCPAQDLDQKQTWDGSLTTPVHLIPLKDEFDQPILPSESYRLPFSHRFTCAPCHDYQTVQGGLHFNAGSPSLDGRPGEPWVWVDPRSGTVLPLTHREWDGMWHPRDLELTPWDFTNLFARHMTGGGVGEVATRDFTPGSRWEVSGILEINCMGCHNASRMQSHSEWAKQVLRQNYRWAAAAASGLGEVGGMASRLPGTWDIFDGPNPDDTEWAVVPNVAYRPELFDSKFRVHFDIAEKVEDRRCLTCHSVTPAGLSRYQVGEDVHAAAGLRCVDCHRHDVSHRMVRGYLGEADEYDYPEAASFTCRGCHLGEGEKHSRVEQAGRLGAPRPRHAGIPAVHFERLSCTVCHSGPVPRPELTRVRTSRSNRLGIYGIARWDTEFPFIREPVFVRDPAGRLAPNRVLWPSFWARIEGGEHVSPLTPEHVQEQGLGILDAEEHVARVLGLLALNPELEGLPVLTADEQIFVPNPDGGLDVAPLGDTALDAGTLWALRRDGDLVPLVPDFDPQAEVPDQDVELRIQLVLESLEALDHEPGQPAVIHKDTIYRLVGGYMEPAEYPTGEAEVPTGLFWWRGDQAEPLVSDFQLRTILALTGQKETLTEEQVSLLLAKLDRSGDQHAFLSQGRIFQLGKNGDLQVSSHQAAEPVTWPLAHPVRPSQQSLGSKGCTQCHLEGSEFFFSRVSAEGTLLTDQGDVRSASSFMGLDRPYQKLFGLSFRVRPILKWILAAAALVLAALLAIVLLRQLGQAAGLIEKRKG